MVSTLQPFHHFHCLWLPPSLPGRHPHIKEAMRYDTGGRHLSNYDFLRRAGDLGTQLYNNIISGTNAYVSKRNFARTTSAILIITVSDTQLCIGTALNHHLQFHCPMQSRPPKTIDLSSDPPCLCDSVSCASLHLVAGRWLPVSVLASAGCA